MPDMPHLPPDLWHALALGDPASGPARVVAVVGGGGKTALTYRLGREAVGLALRAVVTGTTRFTRLDPMPPLVEGVPPEASAWPAGGLAVLAGTEPQKRGRLAPLTSAEIDALARRGDLGLIALEADGSRMRPFKAPAADEPVIPGTATRVVAVVGADALDVPLDAEHVHRPECVRAIVDRGVCDAALIAAVLASPLGGRKGVEGRPYAVVVNKADAYPEAATHLARAVLAAGVPRVLVTALHDEARPVREVLTTAEV